MRDVKQHAAGLQMIAIAIAVSRPVSRAMIAPDHADINFPIARVRQLSSAVAVLFRRMP